MCFGPDSRPPIRPVSGAAVEHQRIVLTATDGNDFDGFVAWDEGDERPGIVILPDVRGLHVFYEELALRFAEVGIDAVAIDYFGRTAGRGERTDEFPYMDHMRQTTLDGLQADTAAAVAHLRAGAPHRAVFTVGFCFGGSGSWHQAASGHGLAGAIGFYGNPLRAGLPIGAPPVIDRIGEMTCPILALMAGDDPGIPGDAIEQFDDALAAGGVAHDVVVYPGAPHSFFDRTYDQYEDESADAWRRVREFVAANA